MKKENRVEKSLIIYNNLTDSQQLKLEKDFTIYSKSISSQMDKINGMLESGFYIGNKRKWLYKIKNRYLQKNNFTNYVLQNGFSYIKL